MPTHLYNIRATLAKGLPPLIIDPQHPQYLLATVMENRILHAVQAMADETARDPKVRISVVKVSKEYHISVDNLRDVWKDYKAEDRVLTPAQEDLLCQRLDRLTRYGGKAKANEEPVHVEGLISKFAIGVLRLLEHMDVCVRYTLHPQWVDGFLDRKPQYRVDENGPVAPKDSTHPRTSADESWLLPHQKTALYALLEKHYHLRSNKGIEEFWKTVKKVAKQQIGYEFYECTSRNEALQRKHRPISPPGLISSALGKRKRDADGSLAVDWRVWDTACNDFISVDMAVVKKVGMPDCSPPPGMDDMRALGDDEAPEQQYTTNSNPPVTERITSFPQPASSWAYGDSQYPTSNGLNPSGPSQRSSSGAMHFQNPSSVYSQPSYSNPVTATYTNGSAHHQRSTTQPQHREQESATIRAFNALGSLARSPTPNAAATSRLYALPDRIVREQWAARKHRKSMAVAHLLKDQERRLHSRLQNLVGFGGDVLAVEGSGDDWDAEAVVRAYADGVLAEDDQLVEGNMIVHGEWAREFIGTHTRYQGSGGRG